MTRYVVTLALLIALGLTITLAAKSSSLVHVGEIQRLDPALDKLVPPDA